MYVNIKKNTFYVLCLFLVLYSYKLTAKTRLAFSAMPGISITAEKNKFNLGSIGILADYYLLDNLSIGSGIMYGWSSMYSTDHFKLGSLRIPFLVKIYTNELLLDLRLFFTTGFILSLKLEEEKYRNRLMTENFKIFDMPIYVGVGIEYDIALFTSVFASLVWEKGFINSLLHSKNAVKKNFWGIQVGIKVIDIP